MLADMNNAAEIYQPTNFWRHGSQLIIDDIHQYGIERFRAFKSSLRFFVPSYAFPQFNQNPELYTSVFQAFSDLQIVPQKFEIMLKQFISGRFQAFEDFRVYLDRQPIQSTLYG